MLSMEEGLFVDESNVLDSCVGKVTSCEVHDLARFPMNTHIVL